MASWTNPHTATTGEVTTAAQWNAEVRDNPTHLYEILSGQPIATFISAHATPTIAANDARLSLCVVRHRITVASVRFRVGTSSGNIDVGIYDSAFNRLWSRGSFACPGAGSAQATIANGSPTSLTLEAGIYWVALAVDNGTAAFAGATAALNGTAKAAASAFPLPATISSPPDNSTCFYLVLFP